MRPSSPTALIASPAVGRRIRDARRGRDLSQVALAERLGIGRRTVQSWELGENGLSQENLDALCLALGLDAAELRRLGAVADESGGREDQLDRIERKLDLLLGTLGIAPADVASPDDDLEAVRDAARREISRRRGGGAGAGTPQPAVSLDRDPRPGAQPAPPARSRQRS